MTDDDSAAFSLASRIGLIAGPLLFATMLLSPRPPGIKEAAWRTAAAGCFMAIYWVTEAIPIPATSLLPILLFPLLGVASAAEATAPYANKIIYLFLGGFMMAAALQASGLHTRLALGILRSVGTRPSRQVAGFMLATAFLSMWVSNTATTVMMLPMALAVLSLVKGDSPSVRNFRIALLLGIAYGANIGGMGTLIGTPPNALLAGFMYDEYGISIGFGQWMLLGVPLVVVALPLCWLILTRWLYPVGRGEIEGGAEMLERISAQLGPPSRREKIVGIVCLLTAIAWMVRPLLGRLVHGLSDTGIAVLAALLLFVIPSDWRRGKFVLTWQQANEIPWAVLLLFGGGLSLASAVKRTGLAGYIGKAVSGGGALSIMMLAFIVTVVVVFLTELTSNTATTAAFLPVVASLAEGMHENPLLLAVPAALAASCAFMMPVATPPNAIVYGTGSMTIRQMAKAGLWLNLLFIALIMGFLMLVVPPVLGIH